MIIYVELSCAVCNSRCAWCHVNYKNMEKMKRGLMKYESYKRFVDINKGFPMTFRLFLNGESTLHPKFPEFVDYALAHDITLGTLTTTLSTPLKESFIKAIVRHPRVIVNVGGATKRTQRINMGTDLNKVFENLGQLFWVGSRKHNPSLKIVVKMVRNRYNLNEVEALHKLVNKLDPSIKVKIATPSFANPDMEQKDMLRFAKRNLMNSEGELITPLICRNRHNVWLQDGVLKVKTARKKCSSGYAAVRFDGAVQACCNVWYHDGILGNAFQTPFRDIVASKKWIEAQEKVKKLEYVDRCKYC